MNPEIEKLWERFEEKPDGERFEPLYEETRKLVYSLCLRLLKNEEDAWDAYQSTYMRLTMLARQERSESEIETFNRLLYRTTIREAQALRQRRRRRNLKEVAVERMPVAVETSIGPDKAAMRVQNVEKLEALMAQLPEKYQTPILLHYFHGQSQTEISAIIGKSKMTVSRRIAKGLGELKRMMRRAGLSESVLSASVLGSLSLIEPPSAIAASEMFSLALKAASASAKAGGLAATGGLGASGAAKLLALGKVKASILVGIAAALILIVAQRDRAPVNAQGAGARSSALMPVGRMLEGDTAALNWRLPTAGTRIQSTETRQRQMASGQWRDYLILNSVKEVIRRDDAGGAELSYAVLSAEPGILGMSIPAFDSVAFTYRIDPAGGVTDILILCSVDQLDGWMARAIIHAVSTDAFRLDPGREVRPGETWTRSIRGRLDQYRSAWFELDATLSFAGYEELNSLRLARIDVAIEQTYGGVSLEPKRFVPGHEVKQADVTISGAIWIEPDSGRVHSVSFGFEDFAREEYEISLGDGGDGPTTTRRRWRAPSSRLTGSFSLVQ